MHTAEFRCPKRRHSCYLCERAKNRETCNWKMLMVCGGMLDIFLKKIFSETLLEQFDLLLVQLLLAPMVLLLPVTKICVNILVGHC